MQDLSLPVRVLLKNHFPPQPYNLTPLALEMTFHYTDQIRLFASSVEPVVLQPGFKFGHRELQTHARQ